MSICKTETQGTCYHSFQASVAPLFRCSFFPKTVFVCIILKVNIEDFLLGNDFSGILSHGVLFLLPFLLTQK